MWPISIYRGRGNMSSSYWTDVHPTRRTMLPPACCSENFVNVISFTGSNAQGLRRNTPELRLIFREESRKEISRNEFHLVLLRWKNKEEVMNGDEDLCASKLSWSG